MESQYLLGAGLDFSPFVSDFPKAANRWWASLFKAVRLSGVFQALGSLELLDMGHGIVSEKLAEAICK